jgi:hypothetical protein
MKQNDVNSLNTQTEQGLKNLNDLFFQKYLNTRQSMGNRGLYNSGLMTDATTRLDMSRQNEIAKLYSNLQNNMNELNKFYSPKILELQAQTQAISPESIYSGKKSKFYDERRNQAKSVLDLLPYTELTAKEKANLALDYTKAFGVDANGNKTVDFAKLEETVRQNKEENRLKGIEYDYKTQQQNSNSMSKAEKDISKIKDQDLTRRLKGYTDKAKVLQTRITNLDNQISELPDGDAKNMLISERVRYQEEFDNAMEVISLTASGFSVEESAAAMGSTGGTNVAKANTTKTPQEIQKENERQRQQGALKQFQKDVPRLQLKAVDVNDTNAPTAIEKLGRAGLKISITNAQLRKIEELSKEEPNFLSGAAKRNQIANAKRMLPLLKKYGFITTG